MTTPFNPNFFAGGYSSPITPMTQQDQAFAQVFNSATTSNSPSMDDWFTPISSNSNDLFLKQQSDAFQDILQLLPISPPLTASPVSDQENEVVSAEALVALFPDILNTANSTAAAQTPAPRPVQVQTQQPRRLAPVAPKPAPVAIMPKTAIPIAPRPGGTVFTPSMNSMKRKIENQQDSDEAAQKRQKNTDAARRSRLKKIIKMETLEKQVTELESDNSRLTTRVAVLESEKSALISKDKGLEDRIRVLEAQLAEAHRALTSKSQ
ncbi:unnamed protein product [Mucor circinelloides]|uniref:BZIP domain-containing protein n=1 Tax=Mucor circinelloides f. circinelloides (strain 1006PhL) TaxID=1220926 RepID=S2J4L4_MUCC1|nr:hypothetical protein HMPREF1544_08684 [Mucor circinelloides 1006PhL]